MARITRATPHVSTSQVKSRLKTDPCPWCRQQWLIISNALTGENKASLRLEPLKQLTAETSESTDNEEIYPGVGGLPEADFYGPVMKESVAYFRGPTPKQQGVSKPYVFCAWMILLWFL